MLATKISSVDQTLSALTECVESARECAAIGSTAERSDAITSFLRNADALIAGALELISRGGTQALNGLPNEMQLMLQARRTRSESRVMLQAAHSLRSMPKLAALVSSAAVSWSQLRSITYAMRPLKAADRTKLDSVIDELAETVDKTDPDVLLRLVDDFVCDVRSRAQLANEDELITQSFLAIQGSLDGGGTLFGHADSESLATIGNALDALADQPHNRSDENGPTRAQQRFQALVQMCEQSLSGNNETRTRPQPRVLATMDLARYEDKLPGAAMELLWPFIGRAPRLSRVTADTMLCDAVIVPVITYKGQPIAVGNAVTKTSEKVRSALIARDKGCRMPGCDRPAAWTDAHHIVPGVGDSVDDLALFCRPDHRRIHRFDWKLNMFPDGTIEFRHRGQVFISRPPP